MQNKDEAQIEREKQAVAAMVNAKSNMTVALDRINRLELALKSASDVIARLRRCVGDDCQITYHNGSSETREYVRKYAEDAIAKIAKVLP
jgi:hypothetical protein